MLKIIVLSVLASIALIAQICSAAGAPQADSTDSILLNYQESLQTRGFPSPMLSATVNGQQAFFIVDTGAGIHTLATWFVTAAGLKSRKTTDTVTGSTGSKSQVTAVRNARLRLAGGRELRLREAFVTDFPDIFAELRIGGLISPQMLAGVREAAVLDLRIPALRFEPFDSAVRILDREHPMVSVGSRVCRSAHRSSNRQYLASISADGIDGAMLVDSGATTTLAFPDSHLASELISRASGTHFTQGLGSAAQITHTVPGVRLNRGSTTATVDLTIGGAGSACGSEGLLGMDALRQCVLVLGDTSFAWHCDAPSTNK